MAVGVGIKLGRQDVRDLRSRKLRHFFSSVYFATEGTCSACVAVIIHFITQILHYRHLSATLCKLVKQEELIIGRRRVNTLKAALDSACIILLH